VCDICCKSSLLLTIDTAILCSTRRSGGWLEIRGSSQSADSGNEQGTFPLAGNGCRSTGSRANAERFRILSRLHQRHDFPKKSTPWRTKSVDSYWTYYCCTVSYCYLICRCVHIFLVRNVTHNTKKIKKIKKN